MITPQNATTLFGLVLALLAIGSGALSSAHADTPPDIPGVQTFDALKIAAQGFDGKSESRTVKDAIETAYRLIDRGRLLLIAGRMRASAILAERAKAQIELIGLTLVVEDLKKQSLQKMKQKKKNEALLKELRTRLEERRRQNTAAAESSGATFAEEEVSD